jgi:hypothetical protein
MEGTFEAFAFLTLVVLAISASSVNMNAFGINFSGVAKQVANAVLPAQFTVDAVTALLFMLPFAFLLSIYIRHIT